MALDITGKNYLSWILDAEIHLAAKGLEDSIKEGNKTSSQDKARAMIFLRHHLHEGLKVQYLTVKDPLVLWKGLKERYDHQKTIILPKARYDWMHLCLQDFKSVSEYNSAMFRITSTLTLCGERITDEEMLEKTFSTFHAFNMLLQQQYREKRFKKYSELISCLLVAEQNNELLLKNHEARPTGYAPFPEANAAIYDRQTRGRGRGYGHIHGRSRGRGQGHRRKGTFKNTFPYKKSKGNAKVEKDKGSQSSKHEENKCYRCGGKGHWARTCRTPKHFIELYQESLKNKEKGIETYFACEDDDSG